MRNIESLIILYDDFASFMMEKCILDEAMEWLFEEQNNLEQLWLNDVDNMQSYSEDFMNEFTSPVKSLVVHQWKNAELQLNAERFRHLQHLSGLPFSPLRHLVNLKFFRGKCDHDDDVSLYAFSYLHL